MPTCTAAALAESAKCFQCLEPEQKRWIDTYLLAVIAGGSLDPNVLSKAAATFKGIQDGMVPKVQAYLLCQIVNK